MRFSRLVANESARDSPPNLRMRAPRISPSRRSTTLAGLVVSAMAPAATIMATNKNARSGSRNVTLHLDLDHLTNPEEADRLQDDRSGQHDLSHAFVEEQVHHFRVDARQHHRQHGGQRQQHVAREASVRGVDADLPANL